MKTLSFTIIIVFLTLSCTNKKKEISEITFEKTDSIKKVEFLKKNVFNGVSYLNHGFKPESVPVFNESDFEIVLERTEKLGIGVNAIIAYQNGKTYGVSLAQEYKTIPTDSEWYKNAFLEFKKNSEKLLYAAMYEVPEKFLSD